MIRDLYETHILVADLQRSRRFYEERLGLTVGWINLEERRLLYWVGAPGKAMLGLREAPIDQISWQHFAFEVNLEDMHSAATFLGSRGIKCYNKVDGGESPEQTVLRLERQEQLLGALRELPDIFREVIVLCDIEGLGYEEIARTLNINIGTVKSRVARGREQLRKRLSVF